MKASKIRLYGKDTCNKKTPEINQGRVLSERLELELAAESELRSKKIMEIDFPSGTRKICIERDGQYIIPTGNTEIQALDKLTILTTDKDAVSNLLAGQNY